LDGSPVLDDKSKTITLKYEIAKCLVDGKYKDGYYISLTQAQAININDYIKIGENSIILGYESYEQVVYQGDNFNITASLRNETDYLEGAVTDGLKFSYGSTEWQNMTYEIYSNIPVIKYRNRYAFQNGNELIFVDTSDICSKPGSNCQFEIKNEELNYLTIKFYGNDTDPTYVFDELSEGMNYGTQTAYNVTWINTSTDSPYDDLLLYYPFDVNSTVAIDYSPNGNDGTFVNQFVWTEDGYFGGGITGDGTTDYIDTGLKGFNTTTVLVWANITPTDGRANRFFDQILGIELLSISGNQLACRLQGLTDNFISKGSALISGDGWHQVGCMYNGTHGVIILDGEIVYHEPSTGTLTQSNNLYFGSSDQATPINKMDEFMVFNRGLTAQELEDIYNNQSARFLPQGNYTIYQGITAGNTSVNITTTNQQLMNSDINITVCYDDSGWTCNDWQNLATVNTFDITSGADNLSINYTLFSGNSTSYFYSPIIYNNITIETFGEDEEGTPSINLNIITPSNLSEIQNMTENDWTAVTAQVCCAGANCGDVNVSLDPEEVQTAYIYPDGDISITLGVVPQGTHYTAIDEGTGHITADYIYGNSESRRNDTFSMTTIEDAGTISSIKIWFYCQGGSYCHSYVDLNIGGEWQGDTEMIECDDYGFSLDSVTYTGTWTKEELDDVQIKIGAVSGDDDTARVYTMYAEVNYTAVEIKSSLISTNSSATPFWTNTTNPYTVNLNQNVCENVTWFVNATGDLYSNWTFFVYANQTSNMSNSNITDTWNVTIVEILCIESIVNSTKTDWSNVGSCLINDTQLQNRSWIQYDENDCGTFENVTWWETQEIPCDYCTPSLVNSSWSEWENISCLPDDTMNQSRFLIQYDENVCGEVENVTFYEYRNTLTCDYEDTPPEFTNLENYTHYVNTTFYKNINATDDNGIDSYWLNDTSVFNISNSGNIMNVIPLVNVTTYWLNISVNDTIGQITSGVFYINIVKLSESKCSETFNYTKMSLSNKRPYIQLCHWRNFK